MLISSLKLLKEAQKNKYAIGQFNVYNLESVNAVIKAAEEEKSPLILGITEKTIDYIGLHELSIVIKEKARKTKIPIVLHLDHGRNISLIKECIKEGFTSIMFDGSYYNLETNIKLTQKVYKLVKKHKITLEAELGRLGLLNKKVCSFTDPEEAEKFVSQTKIDSLAVAIGTSHGAYKFMGRPFLDIERLKLIKKRVSIPLVLHGASAVPPSLVKKAKHYGASLEKTSGLSNLLIKKAIKSGICKINIDTDLRLAFIASLREGLTKNKKELDPREFLKYAYQSIEKIVREKIRLFGSVNKV